MLIGAAAGVVCDFLLIFAGLCQSSAACGWFSWCSNSVRFWKGWGAV